ncbi:MFS transporter [Microbacterium sp. NEAU-LLC]|uniref:MFS transporter n=1 Tax=Microbacterium helvum TaxID=2773713 RepID=A0ABR8NT57_9MICO|nr:MFS transporter [Microbacterium helvum]MBD3943795.1 MFS transporter [Microbacterium helvum]
MTSPAPLPVAAHRGLLPSLLLLLTVFGPISMDLYLPALPALTSELDAATSVAQLTITACLLGLAAGQLVAGPLSDRYGRRGILVIGVGAVLNQGFMYAATFAYLAGATYVLQEIYGLTPLQYAAAFGLNSVGFMLFGFLAGRTAELWSLRGTLAAGVALTGLGSAGLLVAGLAPMPLWVIIVSLFALAGGVAVTSPPATTLALVGYPQIAGTASSLLGTVRFGFGAVSAPLVGLAGAASILPLGLVTVTATVLAGLATLLVVAPRRTSATPPMPAGEPRILENTH